MSRTMAASTPPVAGTPFSFTGTIAPTRLPPAYRAGLVVVALAMLLLPLIYLGVIAVAGTGVWWHLTRNLWLVQGSGSAAQWRLVAYVAPALAGTLATLFMVKPVFARRLRPRPPLALAPADHPQLFAFIEQICAHVRAPVPRIVQVDCQVNASASFAPHWSSLFRRDLVLTIGLPLVHALSVRELGGVLAHEFGHFAQGSGLRLTMLVRGINGWFSRVVYERDSWDRRLDDWSETGDGRVLVLLLPSRAAVWLSRLLLRGLMAVGHALSCFMMRQMEYDADSYEVKIAGTEAFGKTMRHLRDLNMAMFHSIHYMQSELSARRLPADLPLFLVTWHKTRSIDAAMTEDAPAEPAARKTSLFDTHPSDSERIDAARRASDRGILVGGHDSAVRLFNDFDALSRLATRHHYEARGVLDEVSLVDALDSVQASRGREERQTALFTIYSFGIARSRPQRLPEPGAPEPPAADVQTWRFPDALERYDDRMTQRTKSFVAHELFHAGYRGFNSAEFGLGEWTLEATLASEKEATEKMAVLAQIIEPYERACGNRVVRGLERLEQSGDDRYSGEHLQALVRALNASAEALTAGVDLWRIRAADAALANMSKAVPGTNAAGGRRERLKKIGQSHLARMRDTLGGVPCPALLDTRAATLDEACRLPSIEDPSEAMVAVETLHGRLLLEACWLALKGEAQGQV
jgi:Zn-dependent protease with chaperone function